MKTKTIVTCFNLALALSFANGSFAQAPKLEFPAASPACTIKQRIGLTDIEVVYSRPSMKGREVFGNLVPFNAVWRTGANAATKISFSTDIKLNGTEVPAGSYALYTIPGEDEWTIILNKGVGQPGNQYDEKADVTRFKTKSMELSDISIETFTIEFNQIRDESAVLNLVWDKTVVPIKIEMDLVSKLAPRIEAAMAASEGSKPYYQAAMFYYEHDKDLKQAAKWVDAAIAEREAYYIVHLKAKILARMGDKPGAIAAAKRSTELAIKAKDAGFVKLNKDLIQTLN